MTEKSISCDSYFDISGLDCAAPFSKLNKSLKELEAGKTLMAVSQKQTLQSDIPAFCRQKELDLIGQGETNSQFYFLIKK